MKTAKTELQNVMRGQSLKIGPYAIAIPEQTGNESVLGGGSYGKVLSAFCNGRACALKVSRSRHAEEEAAHEVRQYKMLEKLPASYQQWFPELLSSDVAAVPWPGMSTSLCGTSLADWIESAALCKEQCFSHLCLSRLCTAKQVFYTY